MNKAQIDWKEEAKKAAEKGIKFDTMTIEPMYVKWYQELSAITNGISVPFKNSSKTSQVVEAAALSRVEKEQEAYIKLLWISLKGMKK